MKRRPFLAITLASPLYASCRPISLDSLNGHVRSGPPDASSEQAQSASERFVVSSPDAPEGMIPAAYTCDGRAETPAIIWSGAPSATVSYAVTMHTQVSIIETHTYLVVYDIPQSVHGLPSNSVDIGTFGTNSINGRRECPHPGSKGPAMKDSILTVFALKSVPTVPDPKEGVTRQDLLSSTSRITLASASFTVTYADPSNS